MRLNFLKHPGTGLVFRVQRRSFNSSGIAGTTNLRKTIRNGKIILNEGLLKNSGKMVTIDDSKLKGKKSIQNSETWNI